ncbi:beta-propeller domain-containing protein [Bacillus marasmi]|uniref:beta-propeller domain-containing protein n=1 Tax=Bacillus marasmi TaxID=1926279 RepID=UPI00164D4EB7|nr:beta-propeller domain-containing protein [Bacillus marasmi]
MKILWGVSGILVAVLTIIIIYVYLQPSSEPKWNEWTDGELPVIGTKAKLDNYFKKIIKDTESTRSFFGAQENLIESKASDATSADSSGNQQASETNVQVEGVDEADIVKTDGNYIYQVRQNQVTIIEVNQARNMKVASSISYDPSFLPTELYLYQNQLVVIGQSHKYEAYGNTNQSAVADMKMAPVSQATKAVVYNVENPEKPVQIREIKLDGAYVSSRRIDGLVYLITNQFPEYWILEENKAIDLRPTFSDSVVSTSSIPVDYDKIQYFPDSKEANYTMIASFNLAQPEKEAAITTYLGSGNQLYMSKDNLYLAVPHYEEKAFDLSNKVNTPDSTIYKFSVKDTEVKFHSSAVVPGTLLNQFSMDEYNGYFRLVTTKGYAWDERQPSTNQLLILNENLKQVGNLSELARGERIYSARFLGDKIYMVTFKETDPLFVIDAKEPTQPKVLGELKIPGFSNYLHPYDENHIIGFGQDTKLVDDKASNGPPRVITNGVKISLFDVSDMSNPKEKYTEVIGGRGTYSTLNYDHKALLFNKNKDLFGFPISVYQNSTKNEYEQIYEFQGAYLYKINPETGFTLQLKISHETEKGQFEQWENTIQRLVTIGDTIYALSPDNISAHDLTSNAQIGELSLK